MILKVLWYTDRINTLPSEVYVKQIFSRPQVIAFLSVWLAIFLICSVLSAIAYSVIESIPLTTTPIITTAPHGNGGTTAPTTTTTPVTTDPPVPVDPDDPYGKLTYSSANSKYVIYVDAGHGWSDPGVVVNENGEVCNDSTHDHSTDAKEKDINLAISKKLKKALEAMGYKVKETRPSDNESDCPVALSEYGMFNVQRRAYYLIDQNPDYCISIHCNSLDGDASTSGTRIYHYKTKTESKAFSSQVINYLMDCMGLKATQHENNFAITRDCTMPAILIEAGFMTSPTDLKNLQDPNWQDQFACAIAQGMDAYIHAGN